MIEKMREAIEIGRQREIQMIGAAISNRDWHGVEVAYNQLRDRLDRLIHTPEWTTIPARDGIEARYGLNDTYPGDPVRVRTDSVADGGDSPVAAAGEDWKSELMDLADLLAGVLYSDSGPKRNAAIKAANDWWTAYDEWLRTDGAALSTLKDKQGEAR